MKRDRHRRVNEGKRERKRMWLVVECIDEERERETPKMRATNYASVSTGRKREAVCLSLRYVMCLVAFSLDCNLGKENVHFRPSSSCERRWWCKRRGDDGMISGYWIFVSLIPFPPTRKRMMTLSSWGGTTTKQRKRKRGWDGKSCKVLKMKDDITRNLSPPLSFRFISFSIWDLVCVSACYFLVFEGFVSLSM